MGGEECINHVLKDSAGFGDSYKWGANKFSM